MNRGTAEEAEDEFWPLSGKPYFGVIIGKTQIKPLYQLNVPAKMHRVLPHVVLPVVLNYCGKSWKMVYYGDNAHKRFDPRWKYFVIDNNLKVGDACVFELTECSNSKLKFRVQILRGDFPSELLTKAKGVTSNAPINID